MKAYIIPITIACSLLAISCKKNGLDEQVYSSIYTEKFYKTAADAEAALTAAYGPMVSLYNTAGTCASDFSADQSYARPVVGRDTYALFNYDQNYTTQKSFGRDYESPLAIWRSCYAGIEKCNWVLERVPATNMDAARRSVIIGEAFFLRAFYHWTLTKNFGDIILKIHSSTDPASAYAPVVPKANIYKQIYTDVDSAVANLPSYSASIQKGRPSKETAFALYAKAALYGENYALALEKAEEVINSGKYNLMIDVRDLYNVGKEDEARKENIWAYECESITPGVGSQIHSLWGPRSSNGPEYLVQSFGSALVYQSFFDSFDPKDKRRQMLDTSYVGKNGKVVHQKDIDVATPQAVLLKKYQDPNSNGPRGATNIQILRLADVYLIASEAEARLNGASSTAYNYINTIRHRAGLNDLTAALSQEAFVDSVLQERSWEFFGEGDRWYDLTRTNKFLSVIPTAVNNIYPVRTPAEKNKYFPIPLDEINANPGIEQNPAWR